MADPTAPPGRTQSVTRAIAVLRFLGDRPDAGVTEVANELGVSPSTAHRLLRTLGDEGFVDQDPRTERYHLGPALVALGRAADTRLGFAAVAPRLHQLSEVTGESVNLGVLRGDEVLVVFDIPSAQQLRFEQRAGTRVPAHRSAMGRVLLAHLGDPGSPDAGSGGTGFGGTAAGEIREQGWTLLDGERVAGVRSLAAPVRDRSGAVVAALAVQGPTARLGDERLPDLVAALRRTAVEMADELG